MYILEKCCIEYGEKKQTLNAEIKSLKEKLNLEEQEHQKQKEAWKEAFASEHQKLLEFQEEMTEEREILRRELKETMDELERLHTKESKVDELLKRLEQENESQAEELAWLEEKLKGFVHAPPPCMAASSCALYNLPSTYSALFFSLDVANISLYFKLEKNFLLSHTFRMLLDAEAKIALKNEEIKRIKDSSAVQVANLQAKLEEQSKYLTKQLEMERKTIAEKVESDYREQIETWHALYEELYNKVKPFQKQLDAYEAEKNALLNEQGVAQEELNKISDAYAKLLGHQNQKQKIKHVMKLKEENTQLKQEVSRLRAQIAKEKKARGDLQEQMNAIQGIKRFDPSKAFQHSAKENVAPKTPFKESECL
uniref:Hyaluronan mediated motility receptor n=1 Tax=Varanus komodoensis TaxID=61221 RepID=A0A8D2JBK2_VARKO